MYNGFAKICKMFLILQRKNKPKKFRLSNIQTFEIPKTLENKIIHSLEIIEIYIYIYIIVEICQIVSNIAKKKNELKIIDVKTSKMTRNLRIKRFNSYKL